MYEAQRPYTGASSDRRVSSINWRPCTFAYDSLSRPTSASNPESGAITYTYDANGNMTDDALNSVGYDAETRLLTSNGSNYSYDANGFRYKEFSSSQKPKSYDRSPTGTLPWMTSAQTVR